MIQVNLSNTGNIPPLAQALDEYIQRYDIMSQALVFKRRVGRKEIWSKIRVGGELPSRLRFHTTYQTLHPIKK